MAAEMTDTQKCFLDNKEAIEKALDIETCRYKRFRVPFCLAVFYCDIPGYVGDMARQIHKTDLFIALDVHYAGIVYAHTNLENALKACQTALLSFERHHPHNRLYVGVTSVESVHTNQDIVTRAFYALNYAKQDRFSNIEDDSAISSVAHTRLWF